MKKLRLKYEPGGRFGDYGDRDICINTIQLREFLLSNVEKFSRKEDLIDNKEILENKHKQIFYYVEEELTKIRKLIRDHNKTVDFNNKFEELINE